MEAMMLIAGILIALGIIAFVYQGITYKAHETAFESVRLQVPTRRHRTLPIFPILGAVALAGGLVVLFAKNSKLLVPVIAGNE